MKLRHCRVFSRACGAAITLDYLSPRPGLSHIGSEKPGLPGIGFLLSASSSVPACFEACRKCLAYSRINRSCGVSGTWSRSCREALVYGNTSAGALLLLVFQAAALGYALATRSTNSIESIMGSITELVEREKELPLRFYHVYRWLSPSYLARIGYGALPDIHNPFYREQLPSSRVFVCEAGLYDNVLGELCKGFPQSLGYAYPVLREAIDYGKSLREAIATATSMVSSSFGDFIYKRKKSGPSSSADIVVNATARLLYEAFLSKTLIPL